MIGFIILIFFLYAILIIALTIGFTNVTSFHFKAKKTQTSFTVIIPFRNEALHLPLLLASISKLNYTKELVEFIFVDDDSSDNSVALIQNHNLPYTYKVINNQRTSNSPKKDAIATAILRAKNNWIITTDADCILPNKWLKTLDSFIQQKQPNMVVAPVNYQVNNSFLEQFQLVDFMSLQGTTMGGFGIQFPFLCNGANLAYKKDVFLDVNGFKGNDTIASGDDVFLFEKFITHHKEKVAYLKSKDAIVTTYPVKTWSALIQQRARWAAKTSSLRSLKVKLIGFLIIATNSIVFTALCTGNLKTMCMLFVLKMSIDVLLLLPTMSFFNHKKTFLKWYLISSMLYPIFSIYIVIISTTTKYSWKGRRFKK